LNVAVEELRAHPDLNVVAVWNTIEEIRDAQRASSVTAARDSIRIAVDLVSRGIRNLPIGA